MQLYPNNKNMVKEMILEFVSKPLEALCLYDYVLL